MQLFFIGTPTLRTTVKLVSETDIIIRSVGVLHSIPTTYLLQRNALIIIQSHISQQQ